ncbi:MAG: Holliday junction branch migration protein RuvA [Gammaproteobacteria bacterium]
MIGRLSGTLIAKHPPQLVIDVNGVGYELQAPMSTFYDLPDVGQPITLFTHLVVREDAQLLFGFATENERQLFRDLIRVTGVGAKMAITILSGTSVDGFIRCVQDNDSAALTRLPGVGKKTSERLIVEMRDRLSSRSVSGTGLSAGMLLSSSSSPQQEAISALVGLGYKLPEAQRMVSNLNTSNLSSEKIIRSALQAAAR